MKRVCVYCGSNAGSLHLYAGAAREFGMELARRNLGLVYGGGRVGLMGVVADTVLAQGKEVIGVIPSALAAKEIAHTGLKDLRVVKTMHARKAMMMELSDAFIAMPGGYGTLDELFEALTWGQLGLHQKPIGLLNVAGYYDSLLAFLKHSADRRFISATHRDMLLCEKEPAKLLDLLAQAKPVQEQKWIDKKDV